MKWNLVAAVASVGIQLQAAPGTTDPVLTGIVNLPELKVAVISRGAGEFVLGEGQRDNDVGVREIRPDEGRVEVSIRGASTNDMWLDLPLVSSAGPSIALKDASLSSLLYLYAQCAGRSLLQHPSLPRDTKFTLSIRAATHTNARRAFESALEEKSIAIIPDGNFIMVVPKTEVSRVKPHAPKLIPPGKEPEHQPTTSHDTSENEIIPAGMIDLRGADDNNVIVLYTDLIGKKLDRSERLPWSAQPGISFLSITPLTREEARYAIETLLAWRGIKVVPTAEDSVKAVRVTGK